MSAVFWSMLTHMLCYFVGCWAGKTLEKEKYDASGCKSDNESGRETTSPGVGGEIQDGIGSRIPASIKIEILYHRTDRDGKDDVGRVYT